MTANDFRKLALALPEAVESAHMGHPDFRVRSRIFATIGPDESWGMVKLSLDQQRVYMEREPDVFVPIAGGWGRKGATMVHLAPASKSIVRPALIAAWRNVAPKRLAQEHSTLE